MYALTVIVRKFMRSNVLDKVLDTSLTVNTNEDLRHGYVSNSLTSGCVSDDLISECICMNICTVSLSLSPNTLP